MAEVYYAELVDVVVSNDGPVLAATKASLSTLDLPPSDSGVKAVLLKLAAAVDDIGTDGTRDGKLDNVTIPTYLRYAEALGMTPAARKAVAKSPEAVKPAQTGLGAAKDLLPQGLRVVS